MQSFSSDCLPSRRLLRAVKCLLPVYCVSNCSLGGENISQFTYSNENRIKSSEGWGRSSMKPRDSNTMQPWAAQVPLHYPFSLVRVTFPYSQTRVIHHYGAGDCWYSKRVIPKREFDGYSRWSYQIVSKARVINLINFTCTFISLSSQVSYKQLNSHQICSVKMQ